MIYVYFDDDDLTNKRHLKTFSKLQQPNAARNDMRRRDLIYVLFKPNREYKTQPRNQTPKSMFSSHLNEQIASLL
jgi:hypothetical protein